MTSDLQKLQAKLGSHPPCHSNWPVPHLLMILTRNLGYENWIRSGMGMFVAHNYFHQNCSSFLLHNRFSYWQEKQKRRVETCEGECVRLPKVSIQSKWYSVKTLISFWYGSCDWTKVSILFQKKSKELVSRYF